MELVTPQLTYKTSTHSKDKNYIFCEVCDHAVVVNKDQLDGSSTQCERCGNQHKKSKANAIEHTLFFSLTALILYVPANLLPFMNFEMHGNTNNATIWSGIVTLFKDGSIFLAAIVFLASMVVPLLKLLALFYLSLYPNSESNRKFKTKLLKFIEVIGPWSMLDIFLVAVFVAVVKLDSMANVSAGPGSAIFLLVVIFSMLASKNFNSKVIWQENENK